MACSLFQEVRVLCTFRTGRLSLTSNFHQFHLKNIQLLLDMDGKSKEEASRRVGANIIIDPNWDPSSSSSEDNGARRKFNDLQEGLSAAKEGDVVYLEQGFYYREEVYSYLMRYLTTIDRTIWLPGFHRPLFDHAYRKQHKRGSIGQQGGAHPPGLQEKTI